MSDQPKLVNRNAAVSPSESKAAENPEPMDVKIEPPAEKTKTDAIKALKEQHGKPVSEETSGNGEEPTRDKV